MMAREKICWQRSVALTTLGFIAVLAIAAAFWACCPASAYADGAGDDPPTADTAGGGSDAPGSNDAGGAAGTPGGSAGEGKAGAGNAGDAGNASGAGNAGDAGNAGGADNTGNANGTTDTPNAGGGPSDGNGSVEQDSELDMTNGITPFPEDEVQDELGVVDSLSALWVDKGNLVVKWTGGAEGDSFQVQVRELFSGDGSWTIAKTTTSHRATISTVRGVRIRYGQMFEVRVRTVNGARTGEWSKGLFVYVSRHTARSHVYSHRGSYKKKYEMHSFKAYKRAIAQGSKNLELDVRTSKSGTLYVSHDPDTKAVTGKKRYFKKMTDKQVNRLRTKCGERIHTLASVYKRYGNSVTYIVELKDGVGQLEAFAKFVERYHPKSLMVESTSNGLLKKLDELYPDMPKVYLVGNKKKLEKAIDSDVADIVSMNRSLVTAKSVRKVRNSGKMVSAYTVNSNKLIKRMIKMGVDTYFTNRTDRAMALERKLRN